MPRGHIECLRSFDFDNRSETGDGRELVGYAAVFGVPTKIRDSQGEFLESIAAGAFKDSIARRMPVMQFDHGKDPRVGTAPIGDIKELREDQHGLFVRAQLYDHPDIERVRLAIKGRSLRGMSFRFSVPDGGDHWEKRDGVDTREIRTANVAEVGPVTFPAYDTTSVSVRDLISTLDPDEYRELIRQLAAELRRAPDLTDLVGQSGPERPDGDDLGSKPGSGPVPAPHLRQRLDDGALRTRGILR